MHALLDLPADQLPIADGVADLLIEVREVFDRQLQSDLPPVRDLVRHVERYRGKMLRPVLVLVSGMASHPAAASTESMHARSLISREHLTVAAVVEMVHMATLVHDDVLDEADVRRRGATVNRLQGNETAVILGDYLIAAAYHLCSTLPANRAALAVGRASMVTCAGELLQLHHRENFSLDEPTYFEIVSRKTAELIATSAELGAACSGASPDIQKRMHEFGVALGVAFQVQDDLLDLTGSEGVVGKSVGKDVEKGKMTLPLIRHLSTLSPRERGEMLGQLRAAGADATHAWSERLADALRASGSIEYARRVAQAHVARAMDIAVELPRSPARSVLLAMAEAVVGRSY